jgi:hypothetical protein
MQRKLEEGSFAAVYALERVLLPTIKAKAISTGMCVCVRLSFVCPFVRVTHIISYLNSTSYFSCSFPPLNNCR